MLENKSASEQKYCPMCRHERPVSFLSDTSSARAAINTFFFFFFKICIKYNDMILLIIKIKNQAKCMKLIVFIQFSIWHAKYYTVFPSNHTRNFCNVSPYQCQS